LVRLHKEGFPYEVIQDISPKSSNSKRDIIMSVARDSLKKGDYDSAALYINGLNKADFDRVMKGRKPAVAAELHAAAARIPDWGTSSNIYNWTNP
jgi:hypothetical protein